MRRDGWKAASQQDGVTRPPSTPAPKQVSDAAAHAKDEPKTILERHKDEIVKQVLAEVNWPEIVRSEIAKKVIQEAARGRY